MAFGPRRMIVVVGMGEAAFFVAAYLAHGASPLSDFLGALLGTTAGIAGMLGYFIYYEAISRGTVSRIGTITAAYPAVTVIMALAILAEALTPLQAIGVVLVLASVILLSHAERREVGEAKALVTVLVLLAFLFWGVWGFLVKLAVTRVGEGASFAYFAVANVIVASSILFHQRYRGDERRGEGRDWVWPAIATTFGSGGVILMTLAMASGPAALVAPVAGAYPMVTVLVAGPLLKERLGRTEIFAFLAFLLGLVSLSWV